jgi:hypothetical protein
LRAHHRISPYGKEVIGHKNSDPISIKKLKVSRLGREEVYLLLIHDLGTRWG